jgi:hypothetical protein
VQREAQHLHDQQWGYYRPRHIDRNITAYHPGVLLLWRANMNVKLVTGGAWAEYLLKYQLKVRPPASR